MNSVSRINRKDYPVPGNLNISIALAVLIVNIYLLFWTNNQTDWRLWLLGALVFSFTNNTTFSLLHEATHGQFHRNRTVNNLFGRLMAAMFPTSFSLQQLYHLGHHRRNRTDAEMFDLYYEGDNLFVKKFIILGTVGGIYWTTPFLSCVLFLIHPRWVLNPSFKDSKVLVALSADHMLGGLEKALAKISTVRTEILFTIFFQLALIYSLGLTFKTWILCYWLFGMNWGSLQYADHVGSKRSIREGAWNLKVNPVLRILFLNYHLHLVHHRYPNLPWIYLPRFFDRNDTYPSYTSKLWEFLTGPRPASEPNPKYDIQLDQVLYEGTALEGKHSLQESVT